MSSFLLGIWAVKETIALRNILLVSGTLLSIFYIAREWRNSDLKEECSIWKMLPIILVAFTLLWVVVHYLFFSLDPVKQFRELSSTWLRAFMASIIGLGTGLSLRYNANKLNLLWIGILIAFVILFCQYIPRSIAQNRLLVPDYDHYLFHLKINTVIMGMILMAGIGGALLDHLVKIQYSWRDLELWYFAYWLLGTCMALWAFVYIVNTRNGIGLSMILYCFWFLCVLTFCIRSQLYSLNLKTLLAFLITSFGVCVVIYFAYLQTTISSSWNNLFEDAKIAVQTDLYPHWQNTSHMGYPKRESGAMVNQNTYERVAWAVAGTKAIMNYPQGVGILAYPLAKHPNPPPKMEVSDSKPGIATHSGWVELGLAFGIPMLGSIFIVLLLLFIQVVRHEHPLRMTVLGFLTLIFSLYTTGEVAIQHGIEILYFFLALLPALLFTKPENFG